MERKRNRGLSHDDRAVWDHVRKTVTPLSPQPLRPAPALPSVPTASHRLPVAPSNPSGLPVPRGTRAPKPQQTALDLAPSLSEQLAAAPLRMDRKAWLRMKRGKTEPEARIDLHGMTMAEAHPALTRFVMDAHDRGLRTVLVITGKGRTGADDGPIPERRGVLRHQVPHWLGTGPLRPIVLQVTEAHTRHGGTGAYYVRLRRRP